MSYRSRTNGDRPMGTQKVDVMYSLKVDNLTYRTRVEDLRRYFDKFGPIGDIYIPRDQFSRSSRGYAFVRYVFSLTNSFFFIFFSSKVLIKNVMQKMHLIVWMELILMDVKYVYNLLVMVELLLRIVEKKLVIDGKKFVYFFFFYRNISHRFLFLFPFD
jgi:hypothetical protein